MTPNRLTAIRARLDAVPTVPFEARLVRSLSHDLRALLDEVERLTTLLAGTEAVLENEREYQARLKAEVGQLANESFARGAEAMRESAAQRCEVSPIHGEKTTTARKYADAVRALPTPEDTK
jgi:carbon monoxide dehydrogenase subunit G